MKTQVNQKKLEKSVTDLLHQDASQQVIGKKKSISLQHPLPLLSSLDQDVTGIALIDKPSGVTSHDVINTVRRITGVRRTGHAGTLDPLATGLLIVLIGREYTRLQDHCMKLPKTYQVECEFGFETDSYDTDGQITWQVSDTDLVDPFVNLSADRIASSLERFVGTIDQTVPLFSAVKIGGKKLYKMAYANRAIGVQDTEPQNQASGGGLRATQELETKQVSVSNLSPAVDLPSNLPSRSVHVSTFRLDSFSAQTRRASFTVSCSSGTYVRSLIFDLGRVLGVGATVTALRRTHIGLYSVKDAIQI